MEIVIATGNKDKVREIAGILKDVPVRLFSLADFPKTKEVVEDGKTLEENAVKKAKSAALRLRKWALADDSGLEVDFLKGKPGIYSARWAGTGCSYEDNNKKLLDSLKGVPQKRRKATFRTVIALSNPEGKTFCVEGNIHGFIAQCAIGKNGFGYDPVFLVPALKKTFAQLNHDAKNKISHRAKALKRAKKLIRNMIGE